MLFYNLSVKLRTRPILILMLLISFSCKTETHKPKDDKALALVKTENISVSKNKIVIPEPFKSYWYSGKAEISSYALEQARYGEIRKGKAVLIFVTEPFLPVKQVKADRSGSQNVSVLKLNTTKNFLTGIYPYSIMSSTFYPVSNNGHALKVTSTIQEWCGHVYAQLNNHSSFEVSAFSYFESEGDQKFAIDKAPLENEVWTQLRIDPGTLPLGEISMVPSLEFTRIKHTALKAYKAIAKLKKQEDTYIYTVDYPNLERSLSITAEKAFPHRILEWSETFKSGFGDRAVRLTSTGKLIKTIKSAYWRQNSNSDVYLRDSLGL